jgi:hypothetical protein
VDGGGFGGGLEWLGFSCGWVFLGFMGFGEYFGLWVGRLFGLCGVCGGFVLFWGCLLVIYEMWCLCRVMIGWGSLFLLLLVVLMIGGWVVFLL